MMREVLFLVNVDQQPLVAGRISAMPCVRRAVVPNRNGTAMRRCASSAQSLAAQHACSQRIRAAGRAALVLVARTA